MKIPQLHISTITFSLLFTILAVCTVPTQAQFHQIHDTTIQHNEKIVPCMQVLLRTEPDEVKDAWETYLKDEYDVKLKGNGWLANKDLLSAKKTEVIEIAPMKIDIFTRIEPASKANPEMTRMSFYTFIGYDIPMEPMGYPLQYRATKGMFENFLSTFIPETYQEELETISQRLFQLREQKAEIQEEVADLQEKINENQMAIIEMKNENEESQETIEFKQNRMKELDKMMFDSSRKLKWYEEMLSTEFATGIN